MKQSEFKSQIAEIFDHWQQVMKKPQARLIRDRSRAIAGRLREGYSVAEIKSAIDGCRISPFHMGENDAGNVYNDLTLICRNGAKLEQFIGFLDKMPRKPSYGNRVGQHAPDAAPPPPEPCAVCGQEICLSLHREG
jgi:hypothetical protein